VARCQGLLGFRGVEGFAERGVGATNITLLSKLLKVLGGKG
jgi:hypothetical protein